MEDPRKLDPRRRLRSSLVSVGPSAEDGPSPQGTFLQRIRALRHPFVCVPPAHLLSLLSGGAGLSQHCSLGLDHYPVPLGHFPPGGRACAGHTGHTPWGHSPVQHPQSKAVSRQGRVRMLSGSPTLDKSLHSSVSPFPRLKSGGGEGVITISISPGCHEE